MMMMRMTRAEAVPATKLNTRAWYSVPLTGDAGKFSAATMLCACKIGYCNSPNTTRCNWRYYCSCRIYR